MSTVTTELGPRVSQVYEELRARIERADYKTGDRLPSQNELSTELAVSVPTISRAITQLAAKGFVRARQGSGVYVAERSVPSRSRTIAYMYNEPGEDIVPIQSQALMKGYILSVFCEAQNEWHAEAERLFLQHVKDQCCHALLAFCSPRAPRNDDLLAEVTASGVRVVHVDHYREELPDEPYLMPDYERAAHIATMKLLMAGYGPIFLLTTESPVSACAPSARLGMRGLVRALEDHDQPWSSDRQVLPMPPRDEHHRLPEILATVPDGAGILCMSHPHAERIMPILEALGKRVPETIGLIGIDTGGSTPVGELADTMEFPRADMLERAMTLVTNEEWVPPRELTAPTWKRNGTIRSS